MDSPEFPPPCTSKADRYLEGARMTRRLAFFALASLALTFTPRAQAQATDDQRRRADSIFASFGDNTPGASVAVVKDGKVVFTKGYGLADLEHHVPITPSTVFDVASVSKQFAGLTVAMLITEGKIGLKDTIRKYIPELQPMKPPITVEHLLHHISGVRDWPATLGIAGWDFDDVISFDQILNMAYHQKTLNFVPGSEYTYSNTGFNLLAEMVQRVTGRSFRAYTDEHLFKPLGMTSSVFRDDHTLVVPQRAFGYTKAKDGTWHWVTNNLTALGSSSLMSSANDMAQWLINLDDKRVGGDAAHTLMRTRGVLNDGKTISYAFGIVNGEYRGTPMLNHSGSWAGFVSYLVFFPQQHAGVVVLANTPAVDPGRSAYALADIFFGQSLGAVPVPAPSPAAISLAPEAMQPFVGVYKLGPAWYVRISKAANGLVAQVPGEDAAPMTPRSATEFWIPSYNASMTFALPNKGAHEAPYLTYRGNRADRVDAARLKPPASLTPYVGRYESEELGMWYDVGIVKDTLAIRSRQYGDLTLTHRWGDDFEGRGLFRSVMFTRDAGGRINGISIYAGERSRDNRFARK